MNSEDDKKIEELARGLPRQHAPGRDLWPGIAARIGHRRRTAPVWAYGLAASLFVALGAAGSWYAMQPRAPGNPDLAAATPAVTSRADADTSYFTARAAYAEASVQKAPNLSPATRQLILKNLKTIEASMQEIQKALNQDPSNTGLRNLLYDLYQKEAQLLAATQQIQTHNTVRNDL